MKKIKVYQPILEENFRSVDVSNALYNDDLVEMEGLVSPVCQGGWVKKEFHTHIFHLEAWRYENQTEMYHNRMLVMRPVKNNASYLYLKEIQPYTVVKLKVWLCEDLSRAICKEIKILDNQGTIFETIAFELAKPIEKETLLFGKLTFDKSMEWFEGSAFWCGKNIHIRFSQDSFQHIDYALEVAQNLWENQTEWDKKVKDYINEEEPLHLILKRIHFENDGKFTFWYDAGNLSFEHSILVEGNIASGLIAISMHD